MLSELDEDHSTADLTNFHYRKALYQNTENGWENSNDFTTAILLDDEINSGIALYNNGVPYTFMDVGTKQDIFGMGSGNNKHLGIYRPSTTLNILTKNSNLPGGYLGGFDKNAILGYKDILAATRANERFGIKPKIEGEFLQPGRNYTKEEIKTFVANIYDENELYVRNFFDNDKEFQEWFELIDKERGILNEIDKLQGEFKELPEDSDKRATITTKLGSLNAQLDLIAVDFQKLRAKDSHLRFTALYDYNGNRHDKEVVESLQGSNNIADDIWSSNMINFNKIVNDNIKNFNDILMTGQIDAAGILDVGHNLVFRDMMWTEMLDDEDGYRIQLTPGVWRSKIEGFSRQAFSYYLNLKEKNPERLSKKIKNGMFEYQGKEYDLSIFDKVEGMGGPFHIPERQFNIKDNEVWLYDMSLSEAFQLFPDHGELDALLGNTGDDRKYSFPNLQGYIWGEYDQLDESKRRAKNLPFNIDNRGTDEQKALYDGLEHRVKRIREEYIRQFVETRADMKAIWQVILTNSDVSSKTRGTHLGEDSFLNLDSWVNEKTLFEGFIGEGVTKLVSDFGDVINRSFTTGNRYQDIYKRGNNGKVILNMHKRREIDAFKRLNLSPEITEGQTGFWRGEYYSEADFVTNYVTAAQKYGIYLSEEEIESAQNDMWDNVAYGVGHLIPVIGLQSTVLFPIARMGTVNTIAQLSKLFSRVRKGVGVSTPLKSIYSSKDLSRLKNVPVEKGGLKGSGITTLEEMTLNTQLSQALRYSALRQYMYSKGPVGKIAWNLGEAGTITGTAFYLTPGEDYTFASGAGLGIGSTGFGMLFPSTSAGNYLYRRYLDPKKVNVEGFVPKTVGFLDKTALGLSLYGGGIASGTVGMYSAELADAWTSQGIDFMEAVQMVVGSTEDEAVQKFCSTVLFAAAFHAPQARAFVKQSKSEISEKIINGDYPIEVKEYASKCLKAIEQYQGTMGLSDIFGYQSTRQLINNDKYGSFWIIPKERGVNHGSKEQIESDISHRLDKNNLDSYSLISATKKELSEAENKSRTEELIADLEARKNRGTISEYEKVNVVDENGNVTEVFMVYGMDGAAAYQVSKTYQQDRYITNEGIYYLTGEYKGFMRRTTGEYNMSDGFASDYIQVGVKLKGEFEKYEYTEETVKIRPKYENELVQAEYGQNVPEPNNIKTQDFVYNNKTREFVYTVKAEEGDIPAIELVLKRNVEGQFILEGRNIDMVGIETVSGVKIIQEGDINLYNLGVSKKDKAVQILKDFMKQGVEGKSMQNAYIPTSFDYNSIETNKNQIKEHNESGNSFFSDLYGSIKGQTKYVLNNVFPERSITIKKGEKFTEKDLEKFREKNADILQNEAFAVSTRVDKTGDSVIEIVGVMDGLNFSYAKELGRRLGVEEIIDLSNGESVKTGFKGDLSYKMRIDETIEAFTEYEKNQNYGKQSIKLIDTAVRLMEESKKRGVNTEENTVKINTAQSILENAKNLINEGRHPLEVADFATKEYSKMIEAINSKRESENRTPIEIRPEDLLHIRQMISGSRDFKSIIFPYVDGNGSIRISQEDMMDIMKGAEIIPFEDVVPKGKNTEFPTEITDVLGSISNRQAQEYYKSEFINTFTYKRSLWRSTTNTGFSLGMKEYLFDKNIRLKEDLFKLVELEVNSAFPQLSKVKRDKLANDAFNAMVTLENSAGASGIGNMKAEPYMLKIWGGLNPSTSLEGVFGTSHLNAKQRTSLNTIIRLESNKSIWDMINSDKLKVDAQLLELNNLVKTGAGIKEVNAAKQNLENSLKYISQNENSPITYKENPNGSYSLVQKNIKYGGKTYEIEIPAGIDAVTHPGSGQNIYPWQINNMAVQLGANQYSPSRSSMEKSLNDLRVEIGEKEYNKLNERANILFDFYRAQLDEMYREGIIGEEAYNRMAKRKYSPRLYLQYMDTYKQVDPRETGKDNWGDAKGIKLLGAGSTDKMSQNHQNLLPKYAANIQRLLWMNMAKRDMFEVLEQMESANLYQFADLGFTMRGEKPTEANVTARLADINSFRVANGLSLLIYDAKNPQNSNFVESYYYKNGEKQYYFLEKSYWESVNQVGEYSNPLRQHLAQFNLKSSWNRVWTMPIETGLSTLEWGTQKMKFFTTGANPIFAVKNFARDYMHAYMWTPTYSDFMPLGLSQLTGDLMYTRWGAWGKKNMNNEIYSWYINNGGSMEHLMQMGANTGEFHLGYDIKEPIADKNGNISFYDNARYQYEKLMYEKMGADPMSYRKKLQRRAIDILQYPGLSSEIWVRLAVANRSLNNLVKAEFEKRGLEFTHSGNLDSKPIREYALENGIGEARMKEIEMQAVNTARNTIDFSVKGRFIGEMDRYYPYLNPAFQGTKILGRAWTENPTSTALKVSQLIAAGYMYSQMMDNEHGEDMNKLRSGSVYNYVSYLHLPIPGVKDSNGDQVYTKMAKDHSSMFFWQLGHNIYYNEAYGEPIWDVDFNNVFLDVMNEEQKSAMEEALSVGITDAFNFYHWWENQNNPWLMAIKNYTRGRDAIGFAYSPLMEMYDGILPEGEYQQATPNIFFDATKKWNGSIPEEMRLSPDRLVAVPGAFGLNGTNIYRTTGQSLYNAITSQLSEEERRSVNEVTYNSIVEMAGDLAPSILWVPSRTEHYLSDKDHQNWIKYEKGKRQEITYRAQIRRVKDESTRLFVQAVNLYNSGEDGQERGKLMMDEAIKNLSNGYNNLYNLNIIDGVEYNTLLKTGTKNIQDDFVRATEHRYDSDMIWITYSKTASPNEAAQSTLDNWEFWSKTLSGEIRRTPITSRMTEKEILQKVNDWLNFIELEVNMDKESRYYQEFLKVSTGRGYNFEEQLDKLLEFEKSKRKK